MNRNIFFNVIITLILIVVLICGFVFTQAVDLLRRRTEDVTTQLKGISTQLTSLEQQVKKKQQITNVIQVPASSASAGQTVQTQSVNQQMPQALPEKMANAEFYDPNADFGGQIVEASITETKNLNTIVNNDSFVSGLWGYTYDSLASRNYAKPEVFEPQMAESWTLSDDKLVYTIKLKKGILWHNFKDPVTGKEWQDVEVTAHDFKFYVDVIKNKDVDCAPYRVYLKDLTKVEVINNYVFKVFWSKKYFKSEEITLGLSPLPRHLYHAYKGPFDGKRFNDDHKRNRIIVGCGPYRFVKWDKNQRIILQHWEKYYGKKYNAMPPLKYVVTEIIKHKNTQFQALVSQDIDQMALTGEQWVHKTKIPAFDPQTGWINKYKYQGRSYYYLGYNQKNELFKDKRVRQAMTHLVDRKRIIKHVMFDLARIITGPFFIDSVYYDNSIKPYLFSITKAKELLQAAGWQDSNNDGVLDKNGKPFEFYMLAVANHPYQSKILQIVKEDMAKAGVVMKIIYIEWPVYTQRLEKKDFEACCLGWGLAYLPDPYQLWHSSQADINGSSNHISFKSKKADELIAKIRTSFDTQERIKLCHEFHQLLHDEQPYTFLFSSYTLKAQNNRYKNVKKFPLGYPDKIIWTPFAKQKKMKY